MSNGVWYSYFHEKFLSPKTILFWKRKPAPLTNSSFSAGATSQQRTRPVATLPGIISPTSRLRTVFCAPLTLAARGRSRSLWWWTIRASTMTPESRPIWKICSMLPAGKRRSCWIPPGTPCWTSFGII